MSPSGPPDRAKGLAVSDLRFARDGRTRFEDLRFHIAPGQCVCLYGPPGCGKSVLLRILAGLEIPAFGRVTWDGRDVAGQDLDRGLVLWDSGLFPWLSLLENCVMACDAARPDLPPGPARAQAEASLVLAERVIGLSPAPGPAVCDEPTPGPRPANRDALYGTRPFQELRRTINDRYRQDRRRRLAAREFFGFGEGI